MRPARSAAARQPHRTDPGRGHPATARRADRAGVPGLVRGRLHLPGDLNRFRERLRRVAARGREGRTLSLERSVIESLADHETLAPDIEEQFQQKLSFGERLADRIADFGGSWTFILLFGGLILVWVLVNTCSCCAAVRSLPVHPAQPGAVLPRRGAGAGHHDEPEPPGGERPAALGERLPGQPQGRARDPPPAREARPSAAAPMGAADGDPADPDRADERD